MVHFSGYVPAPNNYQLQGGTVLPYSQTPQVYVATTPQLHTGFNVEEQRGHEITANTGCSGVINSGSNWLFDSDASTHVTNDLTQLSQSQTCYTGDGMVIGNGSALPVKHSGKGILTTPHIVFDLNHILHTPSITHSLISVSQFAKDNNCTLLFYSDGYTVQDKLTHHILHKGPCVGGLYPM